LREPAPSASAERLLELDRQHVWHPYSSVTNPPLLWPVARAEGVRLHLTDGRTLIDGMSSWWCAIHGYNHPALNRAITTQLTSMAHVMFGGLTHEPAVNLATLLAELLPEGLDRVFFSDSGSVSVEVALKMALQFWQSQGHAGKHRIISLRRGYHGDTFGAMSVCDPVTGMHHLFADALPKQLFAPSPPSRFGEACCEECMEPITQLLTDHHRQVAAVIVEPIVQGAGGMHFYSADYLVKLRALCDAFDVLLIFDEIATGFGRTGKLFALEHAQVEPDILCLGKALTGGYMTLAATVCHRRVAAGICEGEAGVFMHGPTFMGNPLACAVATASIRLLLSQPWQRQIATIHQGLRDGLAPAADLPGVTEVRTLGAIGVIELEEPCFMNRLQPLLVERGVWVRPFGKLVYTMPSYVIRKPDLATLTAAMVDAVAAYTSA